MSKGIIRRLAVFAVVMGVLIGGTAAFVMSAPQSGGYFQLTAPGTAFPTDAQCAAQVHESSWEPRPENNLANHTAPIHPELLANFSQWSSTWNSTYKPRIDGNFQGTTDEIIQWAACKWGWSDDIIRAEAIVESSWRQSTAGDGGNSFGLLQIKWNFHPAGPAKGAVGSSWPNSANSTAYAVDQQVAEMRGCYDGMSTYLGNTKGDQWGCLQSWFSGSWTPGGGSYSDQVKALVNSKPWLNYQDLSGGTTFTGGSNTTQPISSTAATSVPTSTPITTGSTPITTTPSPSSSPQTTNTKPPATTTTINRPEPQFVLYICIDSKGKVEVQNQGIVPMKCAHVWDRVINVKYANLP